MLVKKYRIVYVEVPTGYPGVMTIAIAQNWTKEQIRNWLWYNVQYAILDILEAD